MGLGLQGQVKCTIVLEALSSGVNNKMHISVLQGGTVFYQLLFYSDLLHVTIYTLNNYANTYYVGHVSFS